NFTHNKPQPQDNFYRLKQIDFDGTFEYSIVVNIIHDKVKNNMTIYPNPTNSGYAWIDGLQGNETIYINDISGKTIFTQNVNTTNKMHLDLNKFTCGTYNIVVLQNNEMIWHSKIVILK